MKEAITFDDVLIVPRFSTIESRKDVDLSVKRLGLDLKLGLISANMDSVTGSDMAIAMANGGAVGCLHRFMSIEDNISEYLTVLESVGFQSICSIGLGDKEIERAEALFDEGCNTFILDVAHGASMGVIKQVKKLRELLGYEEFNLVVGNFASDESVKTFLEHLNSGSIQGIKIGIGPGAVCRTRTVTGCGYPQLSAIMEISRLLKNTSITVIADGGLNNVGDCAKALGAGAHLLMSGSFFAGTDEAPGELVNKPEPIDISKCGQPNWNSGMGTAFIKVGPDMTKPLFKIYRGSASQESYEIQGKVASHRTPEGDSVYIPYKGPVSKALQEIEAGLRSAFSYTGSRNLEQFHRNVEFIRVSGNTVVENGTRNGFK